jgi:hypothetical protein
VELDPALVASLGQAPNTQTPSSSRPKKVPLNGNDRLYSQLRDLNFAVVGSHLNQAARKVQEDIEVYLYWTQLIYINKWKHVGKTPSAHSCTDKGVCWEAKRY